MKFGTLPTSYKQTTVYQQVNLDEMDKFLETQELPKLTQKKKKNYEQNYDKERD